MEWYEDLISYLKTSCAIRSWFLEKRLLENPNLFCEFLLECPSPDVRQAFSKIIVFLVHYALIDKTDSTKGKFLINVLTISQNLNNFFSNIKQPILECTPVI